MKRYLTLFLFFSLCLQLTATSGNAAGLTVSPQYTSPDFWRNLSPENDAIVMQPKQIRAFNHKIVLKSASVYELTEYPATVAKNALSQWLSSGDNVLDDTLYQNGVAIGLAEKQALLAECNISAISNQTAIAYGVTVRRANLRALPTAVCLTDSPTDSDFDLLQQTAIDPAEPVIILHTSVSGDFKFIQMRNYRGWISSQDIATASRTDWLRYAAPKKFLVVTEPHFTATTADESILYQMGAKIPLKRANKNSTYTAYIPTRNTEGKLKTIETTLPHNPALHVGFLPYTRNQIVKQSFKFLNEPYGWGGLKNSVDCSSFVADVYRTVGIELPRDADEQEATAGIAIPLKNLDTTAKLQAFKKLQSGDVLFFNGHTMLYLGSISQEAPYIIHSLGSYAKHHNDGTKEKIPTMKVVVSDMTLQRYSGLTFFDDLTSAMKYQEIRK